MNSQHVVYVGNALLADGARDGLTGLVEMLSINGAVLVQECSFINAAWQSYIDRGVKSHQLQIRISTAHADLVDAFAFVAGRREAVPGVADLAISLSIAGGKSVSLTAASAKWDRIQAQQEGVSSIVTYNVTTGQLVGALSGGGGTPFALPVVRHADIAPQVIPEGFASSISSGEDLFCYGLRVLGSFRINSGGRCIALALP